MVSAQAGGTGPSASTAPPSCFVVDLDDTLYPQADYLAGAARAVATAVDSSAPDRFYAIMMDELAAGSDRGGTIDRALARAGIYGTTDVQDLVDVFRSYEPGHLDLYPGVRQALLVLGSLGPVGLLTDGHPRVQRSKIAALDVGSLFQALVITDELPRGRAARKPAPDGLYKLCELLGAEPRQAMIIGDRPDKDLALAHAVGARAIRVRQGEYASRDSVPAPLASLDSFPAAVAYLSLLSQ